ncbi:MAG: hypothetical protein LBH96_06770 [Candidatus Peribacteria bacterium]|jgi:hypothetical protein|nr:hypothetical protein [Candidatus Peribacteria bacterium]
MKLGVVIYTYNKIEEACIQMEIIRELRTPHFQEIKIVHTYNGPRENYTQKYLEDDLLYLENPGHYEGAANLMDAGIEQVLKYDIDMIAINASDCRWIDPLKIKKILEKMRKEEKFLGSCPWSISANHEWRGV